MSSINELRLESNKNIKITFDGGELSSDGGMLLIKEFLYKLKIPQLIERLFKPVDTRELPLHSNASLLLQVICQIIAGFFRDDCADKIRKDPVMAETVGKDVLASQPTISRFFDRLRKQTITQMEAIHKELRKIAYSICMPSEVLFDLDTTLLPTSGKQQGAGYNAHYQANGFHPQLCFDGFTGDLLKAELREGSDYCCKGIAEFMEPLLKEYRENYPGIKLYGRGDSGYATPELYNIFEKYQVTYVIRLKENPTLMKKAENLRDEMEAIIKKDCLSYAAVYGEFMYQAGSWDKPRRVVCKVQKPQDKLTYDFMFIVTNDMDSSPEEVIKHYCARGNMENYIKECKNGFDFRTVSSLFMVTNANRLQIHMLAYNIFNLFKRLTLPDDMKKSQADTVRRKLLKAAAKIVHTGRYTIFRIASSFCYQEQYIETLRKIQGLSSPLLE